MLRQFAITIVLVIIYRFGLQISIPFINEQVLSEYLNIYLGSNKYQFSIFALGIMPYVSAFILLEICSLFIPLLKKLRNTGYKGRRTLKRLAFVCALPIGLLQSSGIVNAINEMTVPSGIKVANIHGTSDQLLLITILIAGLFLLLFITELISKYGIGHGISIILLAGIGAESYDSFMRSKDILNEASAYFYVLTIAYLFLMTFIVIILLRSTRTVLVCHKLLNHSVDFFKLNTCPSGNVAVNPLIGATIFSLLMALPLTYLQFFGDNATLLHPGSFIYNLILVLFICLLSYIFARLYLHPEKRLVKMRGWGWEFSKESEEEIQKDLYKKLYMLNLPWTVFLCAMSIIPTILIGCFNTPFFLGGASVYIAVAVMLDILDRIIKQKKSGKLVGIVESHDIYDASMIKNHLQSKGIVCHIQGYYHRMLWYFFGPHIEMTIMVGPKNKDSAIKIIKDFYAGEGLIKAT